MLKTVYQLIFIASKSKLDDFFNYHRFNYWYLHVLLLKQSQYLYIYYFLSRSYFTCFFYFIVPFIWHAVQETLSLWFIYYLSLIKKNYQINSFFKTKEIGRGVMFSQLIFPYLNAWFKVLYWNFSGASPTTTAFAFFVSIPYKKKLSNLFQFHYLYYI